MMPGDAGSPRRPSRAAVSPAPAPSETLDPVAGLAAYQGGAWNAILALIATIVYTIPPWLLGARLINTDAGLILVGLSVYASLRIGYELYRGADRWLVLAFHAFVYVFFGIAPLAQIGAGSLRWVLVSSPDLLATAAAICAVGVFSFDLALFTTTSLWHQGTNSRTSGITAPGNPWDRGLTFLALLSVVSIAVFVAIGGLPLVLSSREQMNAVMCPAGTDLANCGILFAVVRVPPAMLAILAACGLAVRSRSLRRWCLLLGGIGLFLTANPVSTARFWFGAVAVGLVGVTLARMLLGRIILWSLLPAALLLVFPTLSFGRAAGWSASLSVDPTAVVQSEDYDAFQEIVNGVVYTQLYGMQDGQQLATSLLFFVPRSIWPDKGQATGELVSRSLGLLYNTNVSAPLWEEGFVDFGLLGTVVLLASTGVLVGVLTNIARDLGPRGLLVGALLPTLAGYAIFLLRGALLPAIGPLVVIAAVTMTLRWLGPNGSELRGVGPTLRRTSRLEQADAS